MSLFRITHVDERRTCRRMRVRAANCDQALQEVGQKFGDAWFVCVVCIEVRP